MKSKKLSGGDKAICVRLKGLKTPEKYWTLYKEYTIGWRDGKYYAIENDNGILCKIFQGRFVSIEDFRDMEINKILK